MSLDVPNRIFAVLYVSVMGLTRCYKTTVFFTFFYLNNVTNLHQLTSRTTTSCLTSWIGDRIS